MAERRERGFGREKDGSKQEEERSGAGGGWKREAGDIGGARGGKKRETGDLAGRKAGGEGASTLTFLTFGNNLPAASVKLQRTCEKLSGT